MYFYSANEYYKSRFGGKVYKISLNAGTSCPNRDGKLSTDGCIFCSESGSGDFSPESTLSVDEQIETAVLRVRDKFRENRFIAYFQSFTNTYAPVEYLERIFTQALNNNKIVALSIATRPDCLGDDIMSLLKKLDSVKPVFVELGLQTVHKSTADFINRCYELSVFDEAVQKLKAADINVIVHVILGLPFENEEMMYQTVSYVGKSGADGIKLQLLHVLKNTRLADIYQSGAFEVLTLEKYTDIVCNCVELIPRHMVIHRLTGDGAKRLLIAPKWSGNKKLVLNTINKAMRDRNIIQGSKFIP
ncbi:MAG: TIGR01212 family radical SAM protein [Clostridia bacterium]|nr:TIGR01212 family radical SAM protein [Clostridia bacterium]